MDKNDVLADIRQVAEEEWGINSRPVLLSALPRLLERKFGADYKVALENKTLKAFLQENSADAGMRLVQDPAHHARVGVIPIAQEYTFPASIALASAITLADARAFGRVLDAMTPEEQRAATLPVSLVARLLAAK